MKRKKSPCIDQCSFTGPKNWCRGCGRTRKECKDWKNMKPYEITMLEKDLCKRMAKMSKD